MPTISGQQALIQSNTKWKQGTHVHQLHAQQTWKRRVYKQYMKNQEKMWMKKWFISCI